MKQLSPVSRGDDARVHSSLISTGPLSEIRSGDRCVTTLRCTAMILVVGLCLTSEARQLKAEPTDEPRKRPEVALLAGLIQPVVLSGGNIEVDLVVRRIVVGYSHGFQLKLNGSTVVGDAKDQGLAFTLPFSTGLSVGYRVTNWLDVRGEFKWHRFDVRYESAQAAADDDLFSYDTVTVGAGVYGHWRPLGSSRSWARNITTATSLRYWPTVHSTLDDDERSYDSAVTGQRETHLAANIGIANTPLLVNVSVGYVFQL